MPLPHRRRACRLRAAVRAARAGQSRLGGLRPAAHRRAPGGELSLRAAGRSARSPTRRCCRNTASASPSSSTTSRTCRASSASSSPTRAVMAANPEFQADVMRTVENSVARMNKLLSQLKTARPPPAPAATDRRRGRRRDPCASWSPPIPHAARIDAACAPPAPPWCRWSPSRCAPCWRISSTTPSRRPGPQGRVTVGLGADDDRDYHRCHRSGPGNGGRFRPGRAVPAVPLDQGQRFRDRRVSDARTDARRRRATRSHHATRRRNHHAHHAEAGGPRPCREVSPAA